MLASDGVIPLLLGGSEDRSLCIEIMQEIPGTISVAGDLNIRESTFLLSRCIGLLTNDSAPLHMGLAAGIPVYAIFGATIPEFGFAPIGENDRVIEYKDLHCRPCGAHGGKKCPTGTFDCMLKILPEEVFTIISAKSGQSVKLDNV
jgi:heptosyltransferase-2